MPLLVLTPGAVMGCTPPSAAASPGDEDPEPSTGAGHSQRQYAHLPPQRPEKDKLGLVVDDAIDQHFHPGRHWRSRALSGRGRPPQYGRPIGVRGPVEPAASAARHGSQGQSLRPGKSSSQNSVTPRTVTGGAGPSGPRRAVSVSLSSTRRILPEIVFGSSANSSR